MNEVQTQNAQGAWVPAIPLPFYESGLLGRRYRCNERPRISRVDAPARTVTTGEMCDRVFKTAEEYRGHYALVHVMGLS